MMDHFRKSSFCTDAGTCVEVAIGPDQVMVRDSKDLTAEALRFDLQEWAAFVQGVKAGEFDR